jgi:xanthine dehydrogenase accessory factor
MLALAGRLGSEGVAFALVTVVRATRPTSAKAGDKAILTERGEWFGWVGGSCAEPTARRAAAQALADGQCRLIHLTNDETDLVRAGVELAAMTCHSGGSLEIYVEPHLSVPRLVVFGNSPIAQAVCELGQLLGYGPVAIDLGAKPGALAELDAGAGGRRLVVVASHGSFEVDALTWALRSGAAYVGLVTSQRRLTDVLERLREQGLRPDQLERLHAPAGLAIGATRPAEVALSILSQIVAEAQGTTSASASPVSPAPVGVAPAPAFAGPRSSEPSCCAPVEGAPRPQPPAVPAPALAAPRSGGKSCCGGASERASSAERAATSPAAPSSLRYSAVVLAAGLSRRMGAENKLLLPVAGAPMIHQVVGSVLGAGFVEVVVVLGHQAEEVRRALAPLGVASVLNHDFESGQVSSVRTGLAALTRPADAVLVCLGDQPLLGSSDLRELCAAYDARPHGTILVPMRGNRRGNPVVMDWQSARETLERGLDFGCRHYMDENPDRVFRWQAPNDHFVRDVDEPADYRAVVVEPLG